MYPVRRDPMGCSPPGSSVHGVLQARILKWVAVPFSRGIFLTQGRGPQSPELQAWFEFTTINAYLTKETVTKCVFRREIADLKEC